jgi:Uma2 family endonuclease
MTKTILTYRDLLDTPDDGRRYELIDGEVIVSPAPSAEHQRILRQVVRLLLRAMDAGYGVAYFAPIDVIFDLAEHNSAQPDALFILAERRHIVTRSVVRGAPDLIVEVLSPSTRTYDQRTKRQLYARFGVPHYWLFDPETQVARVFVLADGAYAEPLVLSGADVLSCPLFPGVTTTVTEIFAPE